MLKNLILSASKSTSTSYRLRRAREPYADYLHNNIQICLSYFCFNLYHYGDDVIHDLFLFNLKLSRYTNKYYLYYVYLKLNLFPKVGKTECIYNRRIKYFKTCYEFLLCLSQNRKCSSSFKNCKCFFHNRLCMPQRFSIEAT